MKHRWVTDALGNVPPASGAVVMGTAIVSIGLALDNRNTPSRILLGIAAAEWLLLGLVLLGRALYDRNRLAGEARSPAALTGVAATTVLGSRLVMLGWDWVGIALLVIAVLLWLTLLAPVLGNWSTPTVGMSLILTVSTESIAVLSADIVRREQSAWLLYGSLVPFVLGLALYLFVIARFDLRQLLVARGDHWVTGGALAISALAAGQLTLDAHRLHELGGLMGPLKTVSIVLWALTIAWLPVLLVAEAARPR